MTQLGPQTAVGGTVAPDGSFVIAESQTKAWLFPASGGSSRPIETPEGGLTFAGWSVDSQPFFIRTTSDDVKHILYGAFNKPFSEIGTISVSDRAGLNSFVVSQVVGDSHRFGYVCVLGRELSSLLIASNIKTRD